MPRGLRRLELGLAAARELRDHHGLLVGGVVRHPAGRLQRADQLVIGQGAGAGDRLGGESREYGTRTEDVGGLVLAERRGERLTAKAV